MVLVLKQDLTTTTKPNTAMTDHTPVLPGLSPVENREILARFDGGALSSNGGVVVLRELELQLRFSDMLAGCMNDKRDQNSITHTLRDMIRERMFAICCGHEDCNDLNILRDDPALKMACDRLPASGPALASQPTLSRLENAPTIRELVRMAVGMIDVFCLSFKKIPDQIMLDIDDTPDRVHGGQQLSLFNSHSGGYCFKPIHIYDAATGKPVFILLRPGKRPSGEEAARVMCFIVRHIRRNWPRVRIIFRGDGHYGGPQVMDFLEQNDCFYIFGQPGNTRLTKIARPWCEDVATRRVTGQPKDRMRRFFQTQYGAKSWSKKRKVIARVEATELGTDVRFIVTNLPGRGKNLYEKTYCQRGNMENLIKEHKLYTKSDRTSCHRKQANQFRLFLHTGAYWLLLMLRGAAPKRSRWRTATFETIRCTFLRIAVRVKELKSRIRMAFPSSFPQQKMLTLMMTKIKAQSP